MGSKPDFNERGEINASCPKIDTLAVFPLGFHFSFTFPAWVAHSSRDGVLLPAALPTA